MLSATPITSLFSADLEFCGADEIRRPSASEDVKWNWSKHSFNGISALFSLSVERHKIYALVTAFETATSVAELLRHEVECTSLVWRKSDSEWIIGNTQITEWVRETSM